MEEYDGYLTGRSSDPGGGFSGCLGKYLLRLIFLILFPIIVWGIAELAAHLLGYRDK